MVDIIPIKPKYEVINVERLKTAQLFEHKGELWMFLKRNNKTGFATLLRMKDGYREEAAYRTKVFRIKPTITYTLIEDERGICQRGELDNE